MSNSVFRLLAGVIPSSRDRRLPRACRADAAVGRNPAGGMSCAITEPLEARRLFAFTTLTNGSGDGTVTMGVDAYGSFGSNTTAGDALFDPVGLATAGGTTFESGVYFSILDNFLTESAFGNFSAPLPPIAFLSTTGNTAVSSFTIAGMFIELTQTLEPATAAGSVLHQTYVIRNDTIAPQSFQMIRHLDGNLFYDGPADLDFGGVSVNERTLFEFDTAVFPTQSTAYLGITASGDGEPGGFTVQPFPFRNRLVAANGILDTDLNQVNGDADNNRLTDAGDDVTLTLADTFTVDPDASVTYTTTTIFSQGTPQQILNPGLVQFSAPTYTVDENAGTATITVSRVQGDEGAVSMDYAVTTGTATAGTDFTPVTGTLLFADQQTTATFTVSILDDTIGEGDETIELTLTNPQGGVAEGAPTTATLTIVEDDLSVLFVDTAYTVDETSGVATLTVERTGPTTGTASVNFLAADGTATAPSDYLPTAGTLSFAVGQRTATITVPIIGDFLDDEADEAFTVTLQPGPVGAALGVNTVATVNIMNVDRPPSIYDITAHAPNNRIQALFLKFNDEMLIGPAIDPANYRLFRHTDRPLGGSPARQAVPIRGVRYDSGVRTATIIPMRPLKNNVFYEVYVRGTGDNGVVGANNEGLDGNFDLFPGEDFVGYFGRGNRLTYNDFEGDRVQLGTTRGGMIEVFRDATRDARTVRYVGAAGGAVFGKVAPQRRVGDRVTDINTLVLNGAQSHLPSDVFRVAYQL
jgi:hypothetical protein